MRKFIHFIIVTIGIPLILTSLISVLLVNEPDTDNFRIVIKLISLVILTTVCIMLIFSEKTETYITYSIVCILLALQIEQLIKIMINHNLYVIYCWFIISFITTVFLFLKFTYTLKSKDTDMPTFLIIAGSLQIAIYMVMSGYDYPFLKDLRNYGDKQLLILIKILSNWCYLAIPAFIILRIAPKDKIKL